MPWLRRFFKKILRVREMDLSINKVIYDKKIL